MTDYQLHMLQILDMLGVVVFAISGGLAAARKGMDIFGFVVVAMAPAIGGGTLRDLLLERPVFWVAEPVYIMLCIGAAVLTFIAAHHIAARFRALLWADAVGLAVFAIIGTQKAMTAGVAPLIALMMGVMTAAAGGIVRDLLCGEVPLILRREVYAVAALLGSAVYLGLSKLGLPRPALYGSFFTTFLIRMLAIRYGLSLPAFKGKNFRDKPKAAEEG